MEGERAFNAYGRRIPLFNGRQAYGQGHGHTLNYRVIARIHAASL